VWRRGDTSNHFLLMFLNEDKKALWKLRRLHGAPSHPQPGLSQLASARRQSEIQVGGFLFCILKPWPLARSTSGLHLCTSFCWRVGHLKLALKSRESPETF